MKIEKHIIPTFGGVNCVMLRAKDVYKFMKSKPKIGLSSRVLSDIIVVMKSVFRYAIREYRINHVLDGIVMPKSRSSGDD